MSEQPKEIVDVPNRYRYLRILREVQPASELEALLAVIGEGAVRFFGDKAAVLKKHSTYQQVDKHKPFNTTIIGIPAVKVYPADRLRLTQFEVLVSSKDVSKHAILKRLEEGTEEIIESVPLSSSELTVSSHEISFAHQSGYGNLGQEIVLKLVQLADVTVLDEQNQLLDFRIRQKGAGYDLSDNFHSPQLTIPVGRLPIYYADQAEEFNYKKCQLQNAVQPYLPQPNIELGPMIVSAKR